jgi:hypothetical protein
VDLATFFSGCKTLLGWGFCSLDLDSGFWILLRFFIRAQKNVCCMFGGDKPLLAVSLHTQITPLPGNHRYAGVLGRGARHGVRGSTVLRRLVSWGQFYRAARASLTGQSSRDLAPPPAHGRTFAMGGADHRETRSVAVHARGIDITNPPAGRPEPSAKGGCAAVDAKRERGRPRERCYARRGRGTRLPARRRRCAAHLGPCT